MPQSICFLKDVAGGLRVRSQAPAHFLRREADGVRGLALHRDVSSGASPGGLTAFGSDGRVGHVVGSCGGQAVQGLGGEVQLGYGPDRPCAHAGPLLVVVFGRGGAFEVATLLD